MGVYLNSTRPYVLYREESLSAYFVDKTEIINELVSITETFTGGSAKSIKYICITRPRRFGKHNVSEYKYLVK